MELKNEKNSLDIDAAETVMVIVQEEKEEEIWSTVSDSWQTCLLYTSRCV